MPPSDSDQPIAPAVRCGSHPDDRSVQMLSAHRPVEACVTETEDASVGRHQPVATPVAGGDHSDDRSVQVLPAHRSVEAGVTEAEDPAVGRDQPVALAVGCGGHADDRFDEVAGRAAVVDGRSERNGRAGDIGWCYVGRLSCVSPCRHRERKDHSDDRGCQDHSSLCRRPRTSRRAHTSRKARGRGSFGRQERRVPRGTSQKYRGDSTHWQHPR